MKPGSLILVTGATGLAGRAVCARLAEGGYVVRGTCRRDPPDAGRAGDGRPVPLLQRAMEDPKAAWTECCRGAAAVVHLAARVHIMQGAGAADLNAFRAVNVEGTKRLARAAADAGVARLVYISSIKVNGERCPIGADGEPRPFSEADTPQPLDAYALSKWEAEQALHTVAAETGLEVVILRPPLVYGPGVRANFLQLMRWVNRGIPLPLGAVHNRRSLIYAGNLADAVAVCLERPASANRTFLISDGDLSTPALIRAMARALGRTPRLMSVPLPMLRALGGLCGRQGVLERVLDSLTVDSSAIRRDLEWKPPFSAEEGIRRTAQWFLAGAAG